MRVEASARWRDRTLAASADVDVAPRGAPTYGPGGYWPTRTAPADAPATVRVNSLPALGNAITDLRASVGHTVIELADGGDYAGKLGAVAGMASRDENILVRPANPAGLAFNIDCACDSLTFAGFIGSYYLRSKQVALARHTIPQRSSTFMTDAQDVQLCDIVGRRRWSTDSDRLQLKGTTKNVTIRGYYVEGPDDDDTGGHTDGIQGISIAGLLDIDASYLGGGGNTASLSTIGGPGGLTVRIKNTFIDHSHQGSGDTTFYMDPAKDGGIMLDGVHTNGALHFRFVKGSSYTWPPTLPFALAVNGCRAQRYDWIDGSGRGHKMSLPGITLDPTLTVPPLQRPSWWSDLREAA